MMLMVAVNPLCLASINTILVLVESSFMAARCLVERLFSVFHRMLGINLLQ